MITSKGAASRTPNSPSAQITRMPVACRRQATRGTAGHLRVDVHRGHRTGRTDEFGQQGGVVAAGADLQHPVTWPDHRLLQHHRHQRRRRHRTLRHTSGVLFEDHRLIGGIRMFQGRIGGEQMPRHRPDSPLDRVRMNHAPGAEPVNERAAQPISGADVVRHSHRVVQSQSENMRTGWQGHVSQRTSNAGIVRPGLGRRPAGHRPGPDGSDHGFGGADSRSPRTQPLRPPTTHTAPAHRTYDTDPMQSG
jgi:hypothetical protein